MDNDRQKFQFEGIKWLFEMEMLGHPQLINNLKMNVLVISRHIKEVELLMDRENKKILVYVKLGWIGRKFYRNDILQETEGVIIQLLPSFRCRATDDINIISLAVKKAKKALGGLRETLKVDDDTSSSVTATEESGSRRS